MSLGQKRGGLRASGGRPISMLMEGPMRTFEHTECTSRTWRLWGHTCSGDTESWAQGLCKQMSDKGPCGAVPTGTSAHLPVFLDEEL